MIRLDTAFHAFTVDEASANELEIVQNSPGAIFIRVNGIPIVLIREDEPKTQLDHAEALFRQPALRRRID